MVSDLIQKTGGGSLITLGIFLLIIAGVLYAVNVTAPQQLKMPDFIPQIVVAIGVLVLTASFFFIVKQYEQSVILRLGKYNRSRGPGVQFRIPFAEAVYILDTREAVESFKSEKMLTSDNVPVTIDAILRYRMIEKEAKNAVLNVQNFNEMIQQVSQTTLRKEIGSHAFQDVISKREDINNLIKEAIAHESYRWGIEVTGVEIRQVQIPQDLERAMSMQAQAERERNARIIYGESEVQVAKQFEEASRVYETNPIAYALRSQNMLYESMKVQGNTIILVPSESLNSIGYGNVGLTVGYLERMKETMQKEEKKKRDTPHQ